MTERAEWVRSSIGSSTADSITLAGRDLPTDIMGRLSLTELAYLLLAHREPTPGELRLLDAVLVSLADHGLTPSALAARLTYTGAPEAIQGAVAAGLLGAGSVLLGPTGDAAWFLHDTFRDRDVHRGRERVVRRLRHVDVIVRMDRCLRTHLAAEDLDGAV